MYVLALSHLLLYHSHSKCSHYFFIRDILRTLSVRIHCELFIYMANSHYLLYTYLCLIKQIQDLCVVYRNIHCLEMSSSSSSYYYYYCYYTIIIINIVIIILTIFLFL